MAEECTSLQLNLDSCEPKSLCCSAGGAVGYNKNNPCPPGGYSVDSEKCQCCRPPCTPRDYRVTVTVHRAAHSYSACKALGETCGYQSAVLPAASKTTVLVVNNPSPTVEIQEHAGWFSAQSCGCFGGYYQPPGYFFVKFDVGCPQEQGTGFGGINWHYGWRQGTTWSVASQFYYTIDQVERYVNGSWVPA